MTAMNVGARPADAAGQSTVGELMTPDPIVIDETRRIDEAARLLEENEISGLPVVDRDGRARGRHLQTDIVRARAVEHLWQPLAGPARCAT